MMKNDMHILSSTGHETTQLNQKQVSVLVLHLIFHRLTLV